MRYYELTLYSKSGQPLRLTTNGFGSTGGQAVNNAPAAPAASDSGGDTLAPVTISAKALPTLTSHPDGPDKPPDPGALNIEFDIPVSPYATPQGGSWIRISGVGLAQIAQAADLNEATFTLTAGYGRGLPLATARSKQRGVIASGQVFPAFGNWEGVNQTLELIVVPANLAPAQGISFNWAPGQTISDALAATFDQAFPNYKQSVNVSDALVPAAPIPGTYPSLASFSAFLQDTTQHIGAQILGDDANYPGISVYTDGKTIFAYDDVQGDAKQLDMQDLIGQPTWIGPATVSIKTALRSDIQPGDSVKMPPDFPSLLGTTQQGAAYTGGASRNSSAFKGKFRITEAHHFGNFRQPDGQSWCSAYTAVSVPDST